MGPLLRWLRKDRRRRFVQDGGEYQPPQTGLPDTGMALAIAAAPDTSSYCDSASPASCCDTSAGLPSLDSGACSAPPDTSPTTF